MKLTNDLLKKYGFEETDKDLFELNLVTHKLSLFNVNDLYYPTIEAFREFEFEDIQSVGIAFIKTLKELKTLAQMINRTTLKINE